MTNPKPELLDDMAQAFEATAEFIDNAQSPELHRLMMSGGGPISGAAASNLLKFNAAAMRSLAKDVREGKQVRRERVSTDG